MKAKHLAVEFPGRINSLNEVKNIIQFIEYILPYGIAKVYMTASRRWVFLEKHRRKRALALLVNRIIRRFAFNMWDIHSSNGGFLEDFHTMPAIGIISAITTEYAKQEGLISKDSTFAMATFKLCGEGYISTDLKNRIDQLHELKARRERNLAPLSKREKDTPSLYKTAAQTLYELEERLLNLHQIRKQNSAANA